MPEKRISCKRCQQRKIRCSRTSPCVNCSMAKVKCEFRDNDHKRAPVSREYVDALERRISSLESLLLRLKGASSEERQALLDAVAFQDHLRPEEPRETDAEAALGEAMAKASLRETTEGSLVYHGPTSIFTNELAYTEVAVSLPTAASSCLEDPASLHTPTICLCAALFFIWQYPQFMFIDCEAFIRDFDSNPNDGEFCSQPLIYAVCAIGALMSPDAGIRAASASFADSAEALLTSQGLGTPRVPSVQALLCCAYYEVGKGNLSKGWLYSGMAFRMGQDLGFQRDPTNWERKNRRIPPLFDNEFRRRLYWGCFLSDKVFSLFLGRPTFMHETDADVDISEPLPIDRSIWEHWLDSHNLSFLKLTRPAGPKLTHLFNQQVEIGRIIHDMLANTFAPRGKKNPKPRAWTEVSLNKLNARLIAWHEALPTAMRWKKWWTSKDVLHPNVAVLHTLYHSTRICLNLPFITSITSSAPADSSGPAKQFSGLFQVCASSTEAIVAVMQRFKSQYTLGNAPFIFVYGAIVATNSVLVTSRHMENPALQVKDTYLPALDSALQEMSVSWALAGKARTKLRDAIIARQQRQPSLPGQTAPGHVQSDPEPAVVTPEFNPLGSITAQGFDFDSPEQYTWDPMSLINGETAYWAAPNDDILAGLDLDFLDAMPGSGGPV
ncbi:Fungal specific transcription factor domain-containing protein [Pleurostoma richardsiae]|uniref:Fungal specific transcription factor domain-containing protein n=1 Tax=Pleurostoma richardsiae TaxID=41990 RepID=A0AA38VTD9_9PEZI|nr:Fungal specific transcription factor domain-containing protein [Pleurostoma richardsiae]